tara:strand:+ start:860 stop:1507 length:648 start_codon:yes stop_codon:yes gene_type:complete
MNALSLPSIPNARLPEVYMAAQTALSNCQQIDECKDWADKAAALASYAKQSQDESLMIMAQRIKARAVRRAGELLNQIDRPEQGGRPKNGMGDHTVSSVARDAGFSKHQQVQATRIAAIPDRDFEEQVEAPKPPTLSQLAQQGIKPKPVLDLKGRDPREFNRALHFIGDFETYAKDLSGKEIIGTCSILTPAERDRLRNAINRIDAIHDQIMTRI